MPLRITAIVASFLLMMMSFLTGCGGGDGDPAFRAAGASVALSWQPVEDPSISTYFIHYGHQSSGQPGSCEYEGSTSVDSPSATVTNLEPNTLYYFAVSAYNGQQSACSNEVSTVTPPLSIQTDQRDLSRSPGTPITTRSDAMDASDTPVQQRPQ